MKKTAQSFLHLPLNEISYSAEKHWTTPDLGTGNEAPQVFGNPEFIHDPEMGTCIKLDGKDDYIELPSLTSISKNKGITIAAWVCLEKDAGWNTVLAMNVKPPRETDNSWDTVMKGATLLIVNATTGSLYFGAPEPGSRVNINRPIVKVGVWCHLAITFAPGSTDSSKGNMTVFVNGKSVHNAQWPYYSAGVSDYSGQFFCGKIITRYPFAFKGCMAHLRVEESALSEKEIINRMQTDRKAMASLRSVYPLDFDLYSIYQEDQVKVMYLESPGKGEPLELAINNCTQNAMAFATFAEKVDRTNYHIQLRFRKNVIAPAILAALRSKEITLDGVSQYAVIEANDSEREDWLSLKWAKKQTMKSGQTNVISIPNFSAASRGGSRNTRVEVRFANLQLGTARDAKLDGAVVRHMEIQSHLGLKTLPLYPTVVGSNTILNDGITRNELVIQIRNTNPEKPVSFNNKADYSEAPSQFELVVRADMFEKEYGGQSTERVMEASTITDGLTKHREDGTDNLVNQFTFADKSTPELSNSFIELRLENWVSKADTGAHYLSLRYKNIPGYQDGEWIVPVLMGPLIVRTLNDETRVGIGTDIPKAKLHVKGKALIDSQSNEETPQTQADLQVRGLVEISARREEGKSGLGLALNVDGDATYNANLGISKTLRFGLPTKHRESTGIDKYYDETFIKQGTDRNKHNGELHVSAQTKGKLLINDINSKKVEQEVMSWDTTEVVVTGNLKSTGRIEDKIGEVMPVGSIIAFCCKRVKTRDWDTYMKELIYYKKYRYRTNTKKPILPIGLPKGWLTCDGGDIDVSKYPSLAKAIGNKTPDLRGKFIVGAGDQYKPKQTGGVESVTLTKAQMPSHQHFGYGENWDNAWSLGKSGKNIEGGAGDINSNNSYFGTTYAGGKGGKEDSKSRIATTAPQENRPPFYALVYIIKC